MLGGGGKKKEEIEKKERKKMLLCRWMVRGKRVEGGRARERKRVRERKRKRDEEEIGRVLKLKAHSFIPSFTRQLCNSFSVFFCIPSFLRLEVFLDFLNWNEGETGRVIRGTGKYVQKLEACVWRER